MPNFTTISGVWYQRLGKDQPYAFNEKLGINLAFFQTDINLDFVRNFKLPFFFLLKN